MREQEPQGDTGAMRALFGRGVGIVGPGRLGASLARALVAAGLPVVAVGGDRDGRTGARARALAAALGPDCQPLPPAQVAARARVVVLSVPDDALTRACAAVRPRPGQLVMHCSGARPLQALEPAREAGAAAGCLHPLQSFSDPAGDPHGFESIACGVEADAPHGPALVSLVRALGATPLSLEGVDRAAYHAAAVFASNHLVALHAAAERAFALAGLPAGQARTALSPLTLGAARNVAAVPLPRALTGPLVRGDAASLRAHLQALEPDTELATLYRALSRLLLSLELPLEPAQRQAVLDALDVLDR